MLPESIATSKNLGPRSCSPVTPTLPERSDPRPTGVQSAPAQFSQSCGQSLTRALGRISPRLRWPRRIGLGLCAALLVSTASGCRRANNSHPGQSKTPPTPQNQNPNQNQTQKLGPKIDVFAFGRQLGAIAPCGCTAEPLGGLSYAFGYIEQKSKAGERIVAQGGSFLFPDPNGPEAAKNPAEWGQINQRAAVLIQSFSAFSPALSMGIGFSDLSSPDGIKALHKFKAPRITANLKSGPQSPKIPELKSWRQVNLHSKLSAALIHVIDPKTVANTALKVEDPQQSLKALLPEIQKSGADLVIVTAQGNPAFGRTLAEQVEGLDIVVITGPIESLDEARLGQSPVLRNNTWVLQPGDQAQTISHLRLELPPAMLKASQNASAQADTLPPASKWALQSGKSQKKAQAERLEKRIAQFEKDPEADPAFLQRLRNELQSLQSDAPTGAPDQVRVTIEQVKVSCHGPQDPKAKKALEGYDRWVATENKKRFTGVHAPAPKAGQRSYVGIKTCSACHADAAAFWENTRHQQAYETLEHANKQYDLSCVGCHVTGFRKPGGSEVVENKGLKDVQCEQCHGPGSEHVKKPMKSNIQKEAPESVCLDCHTPEHSDTFSYKAYLRDILGKGHGEKARKALGDGPTGGQLRKAALQKAGGSCKKM